MGLKSPWGQPHAGSSPAPGMMDNYQTRMYAELSPDARRLFHALAGLMTPDEWRAGGGLLPNGGWGACSTAGGRSPSFTRPSSFPSRSRRGGNSPGRLLRRQPSGEPAANTA